jgi:WD40 repeat protein
MMQVHERTVFKDIHFALVNTIKAAPWAGSNLCASASSDGTVKLFDMLTGSFRTLVDLNPSGWSQGCKWNMSYGCDANDELKVVMAGDSDGKVWVCDPRVDKPVGNLQLHKLGCKVNSVSVNPGAAMMVMTGGGRGGEDGGMDEVGREGEEGWQGGQVVGKVGKWGRGGGVAKKAITGEDGEGGGEGKRGKGLGLVRLRRQ